MVEETEAETLAAFQTLGLSEQKAKETLKNANVTKILNMILKEAEGSNYSIATGTLLYHLGTKIKHQIMEHLPYLVKYIISKKLDTTLRVDKALEFILSHITNISDAELEKFCGVGIVVSPEDIAIVVKKHLNAVKDELEENRYRFNFGLIMQNVRAELEWADGKVVKSNIDAQILGLIGPKTEADLAPVTKGDKKNSKAVKQPKNTSVETAEKAPEAENAKTITGLTIIDVMKKINFHKPGENFKTDGYLVTENTKKLMDEHIKFTGGRVQTRFPPEPNGILHIGHAKAININFGYAAANNGICYLRYDDTNPEKEEEKFFVGIKDMVEWLGYKPYKITHSSDYFDQLYDWAVQLIKSNLAYVCHQTADEMKGFNPEPSKWRDRPIEESLQLFEDMKNGKIEEGAATLRMKVTLEEGKLDPVAYRVKFVPHHMTGDKWCIYPTYDYTHCLCDSIENITHSLCTKEFQSRRSSYYWLCNALNIYCPVQWEYGRLNVNYTVVSKRKIAKLITEKIVADWDDPRLFTLTALRRRGFSPEALSAFCAQLGVTGAQMTVDPTMLDAFVRDHLNTHAPRAMVVRERLKVTIENLTEADEKEVIVPNHPVDENMGKHGVKLRKVIYIEKEDFQEVGDKGYRRLTKSQSVGLRHAGFVLNIVDIKADPASGEVLELICKCTDVNKVATKPKAFIHWVSDPVDVEIRIYELLFKHKNPEDANEVPGGFLSDCNLDSLKIYNGAADKSILSAKVYDKFQFERLGFFSVDPDTKDDKIVFNLTVGLKEAAGK